MRRMFTFLLAAFTCLSSCKKTDTETNTTVADTAVLADAEVSYTKTITLGSGSGYLNITPDNVKDADHVLIKPGKYQGIGIYDLSVQDGKQIVIHNGSGTVEVVGGGIGMSNLRNVMLSGSGKEGLTNGIVIRDYTYRAIQVSGRISGITIKNITMKNISDAGIFIYDPKVIFNGSDETLFARIRILNIKADNIGWHFLSCGNYTDISTNGFVSLTKQLEVGYCEITNMQGPGNVMHLNNVFQADIHHNKIQNINTSNNGHNGIIYIHGYGKVHHNRIQDYQGNGVRAWPYALGASPKVVVIYDNIFLNSRKYSAIEIQAMKPDQIAGKTSYCNIRIYNNTGGNLNTSKDWYAGLVDSYTYGAGFCEIINNLSFNIGNLNKGDGTVNYQGIGKPLVKNNLYFTTWGAAGLIDEVTGKLKSTSPAKRAAIKVPYVHDDYYSQGRGAIPSAGAVE